MLVMKKEKKKGIFTANTIKAMHINQWLREGTDCKETRVVYKREKKSV